jgi:hypothetical protein
MRGYDEHTHPDSYGERKLALVLEAAESFSVALGKRIRRRRRMLSLTQAEVAIACRTGPQQIQKYECGETRISTERFCLLARALLTTPSSLLEGL